MCRDLAPVITLDGLDGTGKSTVASLLSARIGALLLRTPPIEFGPTRAVWEPADVVCANARLAYFLAGVLLVDRQVREARRSQPVVVDRWLPSTLAYHQALGSTLRFDIDSMHLTEPTLSVFLDCDEDIRESRLCARGGGSAEDRLFLGDRGRRTRRAFNVFSMLRLDTGSLRAEDVATAIVEELEKLRRPVS